MKPEQIKIAISRPDGGVTIMAFVTKSIMAWRGVNGDEEERAALFERPATDETINANIVKARLECSSWRIITDADIPTDRTFRNAWKDDGGIVVDMPKAREIHKDNLRRERAPLLEALDVEFMRSLETNDSKQKAKIAAKKQILRDVIESPEIENAKTPEELMAIKLPDA